MCESSLFFFACCMPHRQSHGLNAWHNSTLCTYCRYRSQHCNILPSLPCWVTQSKFGSPHMTWSHNSAYHGNGLQISCSSLNPSTCGWQLWPPHHTEVWLFNSHHRGKLAKPTRHKVGALDTVHSQGVISLLLRIPCIFALVLLHMLHIVLCIIVCDK